MAETQARSLSSPRLTRSGILRLVTIAAHTIVLAGIYFAAAGTLHAPRAWIYYGGSLAYLVAAMTVIFLFFPGTVEIVNERGRLHRGVKKWDRVFGVLYTVLLFVTPAAAGLDAGRCHWSEVPFLLCAPALAVTLLAYLFVHWAMVVNRHAETGVRIQEDRRHEVVSSGPYRFVRHPFYVSIIVTQLVYPLALGSLVAFGPVLAVIVLFVWRTAREDATLRAELPGYSEYASRVPYRLLPGLW
jgi:protein-S-isoprenylcysteine O-methyltransferase Ste14